METAFQHGHRRRLPTVAGHNRPRCEEINDDANENISLLPHFTVHGRLRRYEDN